MIIDSLTEFCSDTALNTGAPGNYILGTSIDLGQVNPGDVGVGVRPLYWVTTMTQDAVSAGGGTCSFQLVTATNAELTAGVDPINLGSQYFTVAEMPAGRLLQAFSLPIEGVNYKQFLGVRMASLTAPFSAGAVNSFLTPDVSAWRALDEGTPDPS